MVLYIISMCNLQLASALVSLCLIYDTLFLVLEWESNQSEVLVGFSEDVLFSFYLMQAAEILYIYWVTMVDKWDQISCVLEQEEKEFQEAMRAEVATTSLN